MGSHGFRPRQRPRRSPTGPRRSPDGLPTDPRLLVFVKVYDSLHVPHTAKTLRRLGHGVRDVRRCRVAVHREFLLVLAERNMPGPGLVHLRLVVEGHRHDLSVAQ
eukprot:gene679-biopygen6153